MVDLENFLTFDKHTVKRDSFPMSASPIYSAGPNLDTISKINPMPGPTNSTYNMGPTSLGLNSSSDDSGGIAIEDDGDSEGVEKSAEWNRPTYNYTRTKSAEGDESQTTLITVGTVVVVMIGIFGLFHIMDTDFDKTFINIGATP
jgi:hypothetical protein